MKNSPSISRRQFLGQASCAAVGSSALLSTLLQLRLTTNAVAQNPPTDYKALVCLFLAGGNDSYNMLIPRETAEYSAYAAVRADLALPSTSLLPITATGGRKFGVHPGMPEMQSLYNSGDLAFLANVGTLVRPTTIQDVQSGLHLPRGLYSHSDQILHWQSSVPQTNFNTGWFGRMAEKLNPVNNSDISMNISLSGSNLMQVAGETVPYSIGENGSTGFKDYGLTYGVHPVRAAAMDSILGQQYQNLFETTFANITANAQDAHESFTAATANVTLNTVFPNTYLGNRLKMIAKTIGARQALGLQRQTFFVQYGGWDHHDEVVSTQASMLPQVSQALAAFNNAMVELGVHDKVTTFTASDFGRSLTSNGKGSDHAWGGNHFVMGGAVNGGNVYGHYPFSLQNPTGPTGGVLDTGRGRILPTTSVDQYNAALAMWFGVPNNSDLVSVLPNIRDFLASGAPAPLGFI